MVGFKKDSAGGGKIEWWWGGRVLSKERKERKQAPGITPGQAGAQQCCAPT